MITPNADRMPRESFFTLRQRGSWKSSSSVSANAWSPFGSRWPAATSTCLTLRSSGYVWLSLTKHTFARTSAFSKGAAPKTSTSPLVCRSCPVSICMIVVLPAPLRPSRP